MKRRALDPAGPRREGGPRACLWPRRLGSSRSRTPTSSLIKWGHSWPRREASGHKARTLGADAGRVDGVWFVPVELVCLGLNRHPTDADARGEGADGPQLSVGRAGGVLPAPWPLLCPVPVGPPDPASQRARKGHPRSPPLTPLESQREKCESSGSLVRSPAGPGAMSLTDSFVRPRAKEPEGAGPDCLLLRFPTWVSPMRILGLALRPPCREVCARPPPLP